MRDGMGKIKVIIASGVAVPEAIKAALGMSVREFALKHELPESAVSATINGSTPYPYINIREALATELGVSREYIDEILPVRRAAAKDPAPVEGAV